MAKKEHVITVLRKPARKLSVTISGISGDRLEKYCKAEDRTPSWTINKLVELYLDKLVRTK
jgi:hypothetical protein